jgi:hypothetical protein
VDLVKLAKIAISPALRKSLAEFEVAFTNPQFPNAALQGQSWYSEPRRGPVRATMTDLSTNILQFANIARPGI